MKYDALEISLLAVLLVAELSLAFTPAFRHRHTAFIKVFPTQQLRPTSFQAPKASTEDEGMGLNELQTLLRDAVQRQDFLEAGDLSDQLFVRLYGDEMPTNDVFLFAVYACRPLCYSKGCLRYMPPAEASPEARLCIA